MPSLADKRHPVDMIFAALSLVLENYICILLVFSGTILDRGAVGLPESVQGRAHEIIRCEVCAAAP
jgi:hypothetical protein